MFMVLKGHHKKLTNWGKKYLSFREKYPHEKSSTLQKKTNAVIKVPKST